MRKKKPTRKNKKKKTRTSKPTRKRRARKKPPTSRSRLGGVAVVEILEVEAVSVENVSDAEVPTEEAAENDFPPEFGGEQ